MMLAWILGAVIIVAGALCYAELATAHPNAEAANNHFLERAYGREIARLFAGPDDRDSERLDRAFCVLSPTMPPRCSGWANNPRQSTRRYSSSC